jgi:hypothetical protein
MMYIRVVVCLNAASGRGPRRDDEDERIRARPAAGGAMASAADSGVAAQLREMASSAAALRACRREQGQVRARRSDEGRPRARPTRDRDCQRLRAVCRPVGTRHAVSGPSPDVLSASVRGRVRSIMRCETLVDNAFKPAGYPLGAG